MALRNIILKIASKHGYNVDDTDQLNLIICEINEAARELYDHPDADKFNGIVDEETFYIGANPTETQMAFPYRVGKLVAAIYDYEDIQTGAISLEALEMRYIDDDWYLRRKLPFRVVNEKSPLQTDIDNITALTFKLRHTQTRDVIIRILGETDNSSEFEEIVTINAHDLTAETTQNYVSVTAIEKEEYSEYDIDIIDASDNILGSIPNNALSPEHLVVRFQDDSYLSVPSQYDSVRVLYKKRFLPMVNLSSRFVCDDCDDLIYYMWVERHYNNNAELRDFAIMKAKVIRERLILTRARHLDSKIIYSAETMNAVRAMRSPYRCR